MIVIDLLSDCSFEGEEFITEHFLLSFVSRLMHYIQTHTPPPMGQYCRNSHSKWPGLSILYGNWVSIFFFISLQFKMVLQWRGFYNRHLSTLDPLPINYQAVRLDGWFIRVVIFENRKFLIL